MTAVVDAGPLIAAADQADPAHTVARHFFAAVREPLVVPPSVIGEVCYLLAIRSGPAVESAFLRALAASSLIMESLTTADFLRAAGLIETYADFPLGFVDASVIAVAERMNIQRVITFDQRHFRAVRPRHVQAFTLLP